MYFRPFDGEDDGIVIRYVLALKKCLIVGMVVHPEQMASPILCVVIKTKVHLFM